MVMPATPFLPEISSRIRHMHDRWWFPPSGIDVEGWIAACREVSPAEASAMEADIARYRRNEGPLAAHLDVPPEPVPRGARRTLPSGPRLVIS